MRGSAALSQGMSIPGRADLWLCQLPQIVESLILGRKRCAIKISITMQNIIELCKAVKKEDKITVNAIFRQTDHLSKSAFICLF